MNLYCHFIGENEIGSLLTDASYSSVLLKDKEPKDGECEVMKETVEDLDDDHEVSSTPSDAALNLYLLY